ncbi:sulfonate ABC transporter substrate-binding protein [Actinomadura sp. KC06]|nr:sulfonate ABC transporter substrate-binding protein [Actinomadura sp. KC06]
MLTSSAAVAAGLAVVLTSAACGDAAGAKGGGKEKVTLMLNFYPYGDHVPYYFGKTKGIFGRHGIDLKIVPGKGSNAVAQAVAAGKADFGVVDTAAVLTSADAGVKVKSIGSFFQTSPSAVQFFGGSGIARPQDLKGKTVALTSGDPYADVLPAFLKANGVPAGEVKTVSVQPAAKIAAVISGKADALVGFISDQGPTITEKTGKPTGYLLFSEWGVRTLGAGLVASDRTLARDPKLAASLWRATSESFAAAVKEPDAAVASMEGASPSLPSRTVLAEQWKRASRLLHTKRTASAAPGLNDEADWNDTIKLFAGLGVIASAKPATTYWKPVGE